MLPHAPATAAASISKELRAIDAELDRLTPANHSSPVDDLIARRQERVAELRRRTREALADG